MAYELEQPAGNKQRQGHHAELWGEKADGGSEADCWIGPCEQTGAFLAPVAWLMIPAHALPTIDVPASDAVHDTPARSSTRSHGAGHENVRGD